MVWAIKLYYLNGSWRLKLEYMMLFVTVQATTYLLPSQKYLKYKYIWASQEVIKINM